MQPNEALVRDTVRLRTNLDKSKMEQFQIKYFAIVLINFI